MDEEDYCELLRTDFCAFLSHVLQTVNPGAVYRDNWHIALMGEYLEAARTGQLRRLIINIPPRSLKSVTVSVAWPAWLLGHDARSRIVCASYSGRLALKHSLDCRLAMQSPWYRAAFPHTLIASGENEKHKFVTTRRGFRLAASVGGTLTGEGGNFIVVDDPLNPAQALNETLRERANQWYDHTLASRLDDKREGVVVVVMQRLHANDLTRHLLDKGGWAQLALPAVALGREHHVFGAVKKIREEGELLHPAREDAALLARAKAELGSHAFAAQYQQEPLQAEGGLVQAAWIGRYAQPPARYERFVQSWDTGVKAGSANDPSVCLTFGEWQGKSYLLHVQSVRAEYPELKRLVYRLAAQAEADVVLIEDKASGQQLLQDARRETALPVIGVRPVHDKLTRFGAVTAMIEAGRLVLPQQASWLADFEAELFHFPRSAHDDQVDALSQYLDWLRCFGLRQLQIRRL
jgi:predicted phage terminase large subunit-like protein